MRRRADILILCIILAGVAAGGTLRVPADYATIQAAVDDANDGDTVLVAPGTYTGDGNRDIYVRPKAITIRGEKGPRSCIIDCGSSRSEHHQGFALLGDDTTGRTPILEGFTITRAVGNHMGGGVLCSGGRPRIVNCIIVGNVSEMGGGGIACQNCSEAIITTCVISGNMTPSPQRAAKGADAPGGGIFINGPHATLTNCLITGNRAAGLGAGVMCSSATVVNCTISGNSAPTFGGIYGTGLLTMRNSIVCGNAHIDIGSLQAHASTVPSLECQIAYSLVGVAPSCKPKGVECLPLDQLFARVDSWDPNGTPDDPSDDFWVQGDYHLKSQAGRWDPVSRSWVKDDVTSPAIDAGDPASPIGQEPFPNGGRINLGAYGGTAEASKSYFGEPVCETMIPGDINGDCRVDFADWAILASHWLKDARDVPAPPPPSLPRR